MFKKKFGIIALIFCIVLMIGYFAVNVSAVSTVLLAVEGAITDGNLVKFKGINGIGEDTGIAATNVVKNKFDATSAPTVNNDTNEGYTVGSRWLDVTNDKSYICLDNADGAAVWHLDVVGPGSSTDHAIVRWDSTIGRTTLNSVVTVSDAGVIAGGEWQGTVIGPAYGGTGVANNVANTITFTGNFSLAITLTNNTDITLPVSGIVVSDASACTDIEGTLLSIAGGVLNAAIPEDHINATMLKDDNAPADEDIFCYELTGTTGHWYSRVEVGIGVATSITDGIIKEADLDADAVAVGDILTYDDGGVDFLWKTKAELSIASSGANIDITSILNAALYVGRDVDNKIDWAVDDTFTITIAGNTHSIIDIETGVGDNDSLVTQGYVDDIVAGADVSLSNLAAVAINTSLLSDAPDTDDLGSVDFEWLTLFLGTYGTIYFGAGQTESIEETAANALLITATDGVSFSDEIWTTNIVGRDTDNYIGWGVDDSLAIKIGGNAYAIVSITNGIGGDNDKLVTQGYVDDIVGGATIELDNLGVVAINTSLISDAVDTDDLGSAAKEWRSIYVGTAGKIYIGLSQEISLEVTDANTLYITASANVSLSGGLIVAGTVALAANNITMTGSIGVTGSRVLKLWTADLECTNDITISGTALAAIYEPIITGADTLVMFFDGANTPGGEAGFTYIKGTDTLNVVNIACTAISGTLTGTASVAATGDAAVDFFGAGVDAVTDATECTDIEGTLLSIGGTTLNAAIPAGHITEAMLDADAVAVGDICTYDDGGVDFLWKTRAELSIASSGANIDITSLTNAALIIGRDADNTVSFITDDTIIFETAGNEVARFTAVGVLLLSGNLDINEFAIDLSDDLGDDHDYSGITDIADVGENVVFGDLLYFDWTQTEWMKAQADAYASSRAQRIALETKGDGQACLMLVIGWIRDDSAFDFGASAVFLNDDTAGTCDDTAPAEAGDQIQVVGNAISQRIMFFNPSQDIGEI